MKPALQPGLPAALLLALLLAGCSGSPTSNYYLLSAPPGPAPSGAEPALGIGPIAIPEYLNRNSMVYGLAANRLQIASYERWAEPLADGVRRVLGLNLARLLNTQHIQSFPWSRDRAPDYGVTVTLLSLDVNRQQASLVAEWSIHRPASQEVIAHRISELDMPLEGPEFSAASVAPAYSELLYRLSEQIAAAITAAG